MYELLTGQPRRVPLRALRRMAGALEPISGQFAGSVDLPDQRGVSAVGHVTPRTISLAVDVVGACTRPDGTPTANAPIAGSGTVALASRQGATFATPVSSRANSGLGIPVWAINASGTVAPGGITITIDASVTIPPSLYFPEGATCATSPLTATLLPIAT